MIDKIKALLDKILGIIGLILVAILYDTVIGKNTKLIRVGLEVGSLIIILTYVQELNLF